MQIHQSEVASLLLHQYSQYCILNLPHSIFIRQSEIRNSIHIQNHRKIICYIIKFIYLDNTLEDKEIWNEKQQAVPKSNLLLISL